MTRLGLSGGIGSGKSTVAQMLQALGATVIDADAIARRVTATGGAAIPLIREAFGPELIAPDGSLDRQRMRERAFADAGARQRLEAIVHPLVGQETARQAAAAQGPLLVFDIPLLVEGGHWRARLDRVLIIDCSTGTQVARVVQRSGLTPDAVQQVMAAQASREQRLAAADLVIFNEGLTIDELQAQVREIGHRFGL
jgi:dephospho-CoA kinase